jgi:nicotinamide-nucleotide amidase
MTARFPVIYVKLSAAGKRLEDIDRDLASAHAWVMERIGDHVFSPDGDTMEGTVGRLLARKRASLSIAESCTGGLISHMVTNAAGSSAYFPFSVVTYANEAKINFLGVSEGIISAFGAVSEETARQMAEGVKRVSNADYGLSVTGIAGPSGATTGKPVGTVCIGIAGPHSVTSRKFQSPFTDRLYNKQIFAMCALDLLRKQLTADVIEMGKTDGLEG